VRIVVRNGTKYPARLILKPFSGFYEMAVGASCEVRAQGPSTETITIEQVDGGTIVTGSPGCILSVHTLKGMGDAKAEMVLPSAAPTVALLRRMRWLRGENSDEDDEDTLV